MNHLKIFVLRSLLAILETIGDMQCKTIGNGNPPEMHCLTCSLYVLKRDVRKHLKFWDDNDRWRNSLS